MPAFPYTPAIPQSLDAAFSRARLDTYLQHARNVRNRISIALARKSHKATRAGQQPAKTVATVNDIVAGLDFGYWTKMLDSAFEQTLWRTILYHAFPNYARITGKPLERKPVEQRLNALRDLRNRVMHHEPLFNRNLPQDFADISEAISWMYDDVAAWTDHHCRWPSIQATQGARPQTF